MKKLCDLGELAKNELTILASHFKVKARLRRPTAIVNGDSSGDWIKEVYDDYP